MAPRARILVLGALAALGLLAAPAEAAKVANPGSFSATVTAGEFRIKDQIFTYGPPSPITFSGTINSAGVVNVPQANISFPPKQVTASGTEVTVRINPAAPMTGTINPLTGEGSLRLRVWIKLDGVPGGSGCRIGSQSSPIDANAMITGRTNPPAPNAPISGTPYDPASGTLKLVNNSFSVPASSDCGFLAGTVNDTLGLPSAAGNNSASFQITTRPAFQRGVTAALSATPAGGFAPLAVEFSAAGSDHSAALRDYRWDFDGDGTFDRTTTAPTASHTYTSGGSYRAKVRVTDVDGDFAEATRTIQVANPPDLTVTSSHTDPFRFGTNGSYTLSARNIGAGPTTGVVTVTDTLPAGLTYAGASGDGWSCAATGQTVECTRPSLAAGATAPPITLNVGVGAAAVPQVTNSVSVLTPDDLSPANNSATDVTTVGAVDLALAKSHDAEHFRLGAHENNVYELLVTNQGTAASFGATTVTDTLPSGLGFAGSVGAGWTCAAAAQVVTCTHEGEIAAGGSAPPLEIAVAASLSGGETSATVTNAATVSTEDDIDGSDNAAQDPTLILDAPDLAITKRHTGNLVAGQRAEFTIGVRNAGPRQTSAPTTVTDTLPAGLTFLAGSGAGWSCDAAGQDVTCTHPDPIAGDDSAPDLTLAVAVGGEAIPTVTNTARVSVAGDGNPGNDSASDEALVRAIDLTIDKQHAGVFRVDRNGTYSLQVSNAGDSPTVEPVTVTDTLPAGLTYAGFTGGGWSCDAVGQDVTCTSAEVIGPGAEAPELQLEVGVTPAAAPEANNTATVQVRDDFNSANNSDSDVAPIVEGDASLAITRNGSFESGGTGTYRLAVDNVGTRPLDGPVEVSTTLPPGLSFVGASGTGWSCAEAAGEVSCTRSEPIPAQTAVPDISLRVAIGAGAAPSVTTEAQVAAPGDRNPANDVASDTAPVVGPDLAVSSAHTGSFRVGDVGTYTLAVENLGSGPTRSATTLTDTLPEGLGYLDAAGPGWVCEAAAQVVTCEHEAEIAAGASAAPLELKVNVGAAALPAVENQVAVAVAGDTAPGNDTATDPTDVSAVDLALDLTAQGAFEVGRSAEYSLRVENVGDAATVGTVRVSDVLPAGLSPLEAGGEGWSCALRGAEMSCELTGALDPGEAAPALRLEVQVGPGAASTLSNTATVATPHDPNPANDSDTEEVSVGRAPDLSLGLAAQPADGFRVGGEAAYLLSVRNHGGAPTSGPVRIVVTLPAGLSAAGTGGGGGWSCSSSAAEVTCVHADPIASGGRSDLELPVEVGAGAAGQVTTSARVEATGDANGANDAAAATSAVRRIDLALSRSHEGEFQAGEQGEYELVVENAGSAATVGPAVITEQLPEGFTYDSAAGPGWDCTPSAAEIICTSAEPIAPGAGPGAVSVVVDVGDAAVPAATATAEVETADDVNPANDTAADTFEVARRPLQAPRRLPVKILPKRTHVTGTGLVQVFVRCPSEVNVRCQGTLELGAFAKAKPGAKRARVSFGAGEYDAARGRVAPIEIQLSDRKRKLLKRLGRVRAKATARGAGVEPVSRGVVLRSP